jgi:ribonuclease HII
MQPNFSFENNYKNLIVVGLDEAGRGPLAGPVVASLAHLNQNDYPKEINDSKKISAKKRREIFLQLKTVAKFGIGIVDEKTIDKINILQASKMAMELAYRDFIEKYKIFPQALLVDGNFFPFKKQDEILEILPIVKGDQKSLSIAAASIIAKETRDDIMKEIHKEFPQYQFNKHAGYPTKNHIEAIKKYGICKFHRISFNPIKSMLYDNN